MARSTKIEHGPSKELFVVEAWFRCFYLYIDFNYILFSDHAYTFFRCVPSREVE